MAITLTVQILGKAPLSWVLALGIMCFALDWWIAPRSFGKNVKFDQIQILSSFPAGKPLMGFGGYVEPAPFVELNMNFVSTERTTSTDKVVSDRDQSIRCDRVDKEVVEVGTVTAGYLELDLDRVDLSDAASWARELVLGSMPTGSRVTHLRAGRRQSW